MRNLMLIGLRGSGKTTLGRLLARRLRWKFVDTDGEVRRRAGKSIARIFAEDGERRFRRLESAAVRGAARGVRQVIATGGGAVLDPANVKALRRGGWVIHLHAGARELWRRIRKDRRTAAQRPALLAGRAGGAAELCELMRRRASAYAAARHFLLRTGGRAPRELADEVLRLLERRGMRARRRARACKSRRGATG